MIVKLISSLLVISIVGFVAPAVVVYGQDQPCVLSSLKSFDEGAVGYFLRPSEVVECSKQIRMNESDFVDYIDTIDNIYKSNYAFYYTASSILKNQPLNYQEGLGYGLYSGENEGKVNIHKSLQQIISNIKTAGGQANASMFWDIALVFQLLRDNHVTYNNKEIGQLNTTLIGSVNQIELYPKRYFDTNGTSRFQTIFKILNNEIALTIDEYDSDATDAVVVNTNRVKTINNQTPGEFLEFVADSHLFTIKSQGARANWAMVRGFATGGTPQRHIFSFEAKSYPDVFPDSFIVQYVNGTNDTIYSLINRNSDSFDYMSSSNETHIILDVEGIEADINKPGYFESENQKFQSILSQQHSTTFEDGEFTSKRNGSLSCDLSTPNINTTVSDSSIRQLVDESTTPLTAPFEEVFADCTKPWQYVVLGNYTVLKVPTFSCSGVTDQMKTSWKKMLDDAEAKGSNKLIIDVADNGGGSPTIALVLAKLMYPEVDYEHFVTLDHVPYNDAMDVFINDTLPWINSLQDQFDAFSVQEQESFVQSLSNHTLCDMQAIIDWYLSIFDPFNTVFFPSTNLTMKDSWDMFVQERTVESFERFTRNTIDFQSRTNPWTVSIGGAKALQENRTDPITVIRGGVEINVTEGFDVQYNPVLDNITTEVLGDNSYNFSSYIILSNGYCGSSCDIFSTTLAQLWRNRETTGADSNKPVYIVTYGGLGKPLDFGQYAGGLVERPRISMNWGPYITLYYLAEMLDPIYGTASSPEFNARIENYYNAAPNIPFYLNDWPRMPVTEGINNLMIPSGVPVEYIKKNPDLYIRQIYNQITLESSSNLISLYDDTYRLIFVLPSVNSTTEGKNGTTVEKDSNTTVTVLDNTTTIDVAPPMDKLSAAATPNIILSTLYGVCLLFLPLVFYY